MIGPGLGRDLEGSDAGHRLLSRRVGKEAGLGELLRKHTRIGHLVVRQELVDRAVVVVEDEELAGAILGEGDHADRGGDEVDQRPRPVAGRADAPHSAGHPVAEHVAADELGKFLTTVDVAASDRGSGRVRHLAPGLCDRRRPPRPVGMDRVAPLDETPAVVLARLHAADELPHLKPDIAGPEFTRLAIEAHLPGIAVAEGIEFAAGSGHVHKRVVGGDGVAAIGIRMINVDPHDRGPQVGNVLAGLVRIFRKMIRAVAGRHVEHPVGAEGDAAAVVTAGRPSDHLHLACRIDPRHAAVVDHRQPHHPRAIWKGRPRLVAIADCVTKKTKAVGCEVGMKDEMKDVPRPERIRGGPVRVEPVHQIGDVEEQVRLATVAIGRQRVGLAPLLGDEEPVAAGGEGQRGCGPEPDVLVDFSCAIGERRLGRALHPRVRPGHRRGTGGQHEPDNRDRRGGKADDHAGATDMVADAIDPGTVFSGGLLHSSFMARHIHRRAKGYRMKISRDQRKTVPAIVFNDTPRGPRWRPVPRH